MGPGSELAKLLREIGIDADCGECSLWVRRMNNWGVKYCRIHRKHIVGRLKEAASESSWSTVFAVGGKLLRCGWWSPLDPFGSIVDEAVRRAESSTQAG